MVLAGMRRRGFFASNVIRALRLMESEGPILLSLRSQSWNPTATRGIQHRMWLKSMESRRGRWLNGRKNIKPIVIVERNIRFYLVDDHKNENCCCRERMKWKDDCFSTFSSIFFSDWEKTTFSWCRFECAYTCAFYGEKVPWRKVSFFSKECWSNKNLFEREKWSYYFFGDL